MANRYHLYQKQAGKDYAYIDRVCRSQIEMGGCLLNIYRWEAVKKSDGTIVPIAQCKVGDPILNENAGRIYSHVTIDMYGAMRMNTPQFSFSFSGLSLLDGDEKEITFHYNSMIDQVGRKIMVGDVIEMTWFRDNDVLGSDRSVNKFYVVTNAQVDEQGWDPHWGYHLWKIKCKPMPFSPEFEDLINGDDPKGGEDGFYEPTGSGEGGGGIDEDMTDQGTLEEQNDEVLKEAEKQVAFREYDTHNLLLDDPTPYKNAKGQWVVHGNDGISQDKTCREIPFGNYFPKAEEVKDGDYFLRIDFEVPRLFKRIDQGENRGWKLWEFDRRPKWFGVPDKLRLALNNDESFTNETGETVQVRQEMDELVKARVHKEGDKADGMPDYKRPWTRKIADEVGSDTVIGIKKP